MAIVTSPVVNMYAKPNLFSETVSQAKMGDDVEILEDTGQSFFLVKNLWDGYTGYVEKKCVDPGLTDWNPDPEVVTASLANLVYTGAKVQSPLLTRLPLGIRL
ncbi:MAG TPA: SH3 domain-containing protein, partial [Bacillota bacterium]|nr:SH3 domain-containing protein [Bacillota bacterium]